MSKLVDIEGHWIDPNRVISICEADDVITVVLDEVVGVQTFYVDVDEEFGWTLSGLADAVNEGR